MPESGNILSYDEERNLTAYAAKVTFLCAALGRDFNEKKAYELTIAALQGGQI